VLGKHKTTGKHHALKVVYLNKPGLKDKHIAVLQREGTYLRKLQHKNIVRCLKVYQSQQQWVFVLEYLKGGMLLNDLAKVRSTTALPKKGTFWWFSDTRVPRRRLRALD
jgi:serine/threonine protein kinase